MALSIFNLLLQKLLRAERHPLCLQILKLPITRVILHPLNTLIMMKWLMHLRKNVPGMSEKRCKRSSQAPGWWTYETTARCLPCLTKLNKKGTSIGNTRISISLRWCSFIILCKANAYNLEIIHTSWTWVYCWKTKKCSTLVSMTSMSHSQWYLCKPKIYSSTILIS